jgi:hypothetical protein
VKATELLALLRDFYREKLAMWQRHVAAARFVNDYDFNNTYQYVINREDAQLSWLRSAVIDMGGTPDEVPEPEIDGSGRRDEIQTRVIAEDRDRARAFVETWRPRIQALPNARHRTMLQVIIGETIEHQRFFEQALAGRTDLLGRRADGAGTDGIVLPERWVGGR